MIQRKQTVPTPSGLLKTIADGFDLTTKHLWLLLLPVLLDSLYWLGPRLSVLTLVRQSFLFAMPNPATVGMQADLLDVFAHINIFSFLTVPLVGVPALMMGTTPETTPLPTVTWEIENIGVWLLVFLGLTVAGLLLTAVYYNLVAQVSRPEKLPASTLIRQIGINWLQLLGLMVVLLIAFCLVFTPLFPLSFVLMLLNPALGSITFSLGMVFLMWLAVYLWFVPHGVVINGRSFLQSFTESIRLVQRNMLPALWLIITVFLTSRFLSLLLRLADNGSWLTLVSIIGHAFINTSLLTATFLFYQEKYNTMRDSQ